MAAKVWTLLNRGDHIVGRTVISMMTIIWQRGGGGAEYPSAGFLVSIQNIWLKTANLYVKQ